MTNRRPGKDDMLEWKITDTPDADEAPAPPGPTPAPGRWPRTGLWLVASVIGLTLVGGGLYAWWNRANTRLAIQQALAQEARVVSAHNIAEMKAFYNPDDSEWGQAYLRWALDKQTAPRPQPFLYPLTTTGQLTALEPFGSNIMLGEVARPFSNTQGQVLTFTTTYFFAFQDDNWQRIAPPDNFWGVQQAYLGPYLTIFYWEPDQPLVQALGPYLNNLLAQACAEWACPTDYKYELYLTDILPNPLTLAGPPTDTQPTDPLFLDVLLSHRLSALGAVFRMASPRIMGYPTDNASRDYFMRAVGWLVVGQTSAYLGYREAQSINLFRNPLYFGLLAETGARLGLDTLQPNVPLVVSDFAVLDWVGHWGDNGLSLTTLGARARLRPALAITHQLVQGEPAGVEARLLRALWNENVSGMSWLANGLNLSLEAMQVRFDAALNQAIQIQSSVVGNFDWALSCSAGPAVLTLEEGDVHYLATEADTSNNIYFGGPVAWATDGRHLFISGHGLVADMSTGHIRWINTPLAGYPDRYTLLTDDLLVYIFWSSVESNTSPSSTLRFQNLRDSFQTPPAIENVWTYSVSPDEQLIALAYLDGFNAAFATSRLRVIPVDGGPPIWEGTGASPHWAPDSRQLVYTEYDSSGQVTAFRTVDLDPGDSSEVIHRNSFAPLFDVNYAEAVWSPTDEWLAFVTSGQSANNQLWLIRPDGSEPRRLAASQDYIGPPRFSADGQFLASIAYPPDSYGELQISDVATGGVVLTIDNLNAYDWSPTGHQLALALYDGLYRLTNPAAEPQRINTNSCYSVAWNPMR